MPDVFDELAADVNLIVHSPESQSGLDRVSDALWSGIFDA